MGDRTIHEGRAAALPVAALSTSHNASRVREASGSYRRSARLIVALGIPALSLGLACGSNTATEVETTRTATQAILHGTEATSGELENVVLLTYLRTEGCQCSEDGETCPEGARFLCTGTLLRNDVVLTARHCVTGAGEIDGTLLAPEDVRIHGSQPEDFRNDDFVLARKIVAPRTTEDWERNIDVAVVFLESPLEVGGALEGHFTPVYPYSSSALDDELVDCAGYGATWEEVEDSCEADPIDGLLRKARPQLGWHPTFDPYNPDRNVPIEYTERDGMGVQHLGDSGSACFSDLSYPASAIGVVSTCRIVSFFGIPPTTHEGSCNAAAPEDYRNFVLDAIKEEATNFFPGFTAPEEIDEWTVQGELEWEEHPRAPEVWGALRDATELGDTRAVHNATIIDNAIVTATFQSASNGTAAVITRFVDDDHYYMYEVTESSSSGSAARLVRVTPGGKETLAETPCAADWADEIDLFFVVTGHQLQGFVLSPNLNDGFPDCIVNAEDSLYPTGKVGFQLDGLPEALLVDFSSVHMGGSGAGWPLPTPAEGSSGGVRPLSFEHTGDWVGPAGALPLNPLAIEGEFSLELPLGYASITSRSFDTADVKQIGDALSFELFVPDDPTNPYWIGDVQLFFSLPAASTQWLPLGYSNLGSADFGEWNTVTFPLPPTVRDALLADLPSARFSVVTNSNPQNAPWLMDGLRFTGTLETRTVFHQEGSEGVDVDTNSLLSFEDASEWSSIATTGPDSSRRSHGLTSLAVAGSGWSSITSRTFATSELPEVSSHLSLDVFVPDPQPNPYWTGDVQLFISCPSANVYHQPVGQQLLSHLFNDEFNQLVFPVPSNVQTTLTQPHNDCSFRIDLVVSEGAGTFRFDRLGFMP